MIKLHNSDCLEILRNMEDASVDHVITDPPYGEKTHKGARTGTTGQTVLINFDSISEEYFLDFVREAVRVARRWVILTCEWRHAAKLEESGLPLIRLGIWHKPNGAPQFTGDRPGTGWEAVAILHREGKKRWNGGGHHAVWVANKTEGEHPTQKPLLLVRRWVEQFTDKGETILDPFMGSGTTGVAAIERDRGFIGVELSPVYFEVARQRIEAAQQQGRLF
jgi:site-specific DNA-methyltransferase (adenine-specific)